MEVIMAKLKIFGESGILSKIGKRNLIIVGAVLLIGVAVYLNYLWFYTNDDLGYGNGDPSIDVSGNGNLTDGSEDGGSAGGSNDYFTSAQLSRQQARDEALEVLQTVIANENAIGTVKEEALADMSRIAIEIEKESNIEAMVEAKGFTQCVAVINGDQVSVIVDTEEALTASQVAQISEIVYNQTGSLPASIIEK